MRPPEAALWITVLGCGRVGFGARGDAPAGGGDAAGPPEFGTPTRIDELVTGDWYEDPSCTPDRLYLVFVRNGGATMLDLYASTRPDATAAWSPPAAIVALNTGFQETSPEVSTDGLVLYFASNRASGPGNRDVWRSTRASRAAPWDPPQAIAALSSAEDEANVAIRADEQRAIVDSALDGERDLFEATGDGAGGWGTPAPIAGLDTPNRAEASPTLADDGTIYFHVTDAPATMFDVWRATGGAVEPIAALAGYSDPFVTPDRSLLLVARDGELFWSER